MSDNPPALPQNISGNGAEIWAWGRSLSEWRHRQHKMRELRADITRLGRECGSCSNWMKGSQCPKEYNDNGRRRGPSMKAPICDKFQMEAWVARLIGERRTALALLEEQERAA